MIIDEFRDPVAFRNDMDLMLEKLRTKPLAEGEEQVYFAGQKVLWEGIPLLRPTYDSLCEIGADFQLQLAVIP